MERSQSDANVLDTVDIRDAGVRDALRKVFRAVDKSYSIAPDVQGRVTVMLRKVSLDMTLENLLRQVKASFRVDSGIYVITPR